MGHNPEIQSDPLEWERFVSENTSYYLKIFRAYEDDGTKEPWNWAAAIFGVYWFAYRKMYRLAKIFLALYVTVIALQIVIIANSTFLPISVIFELGMFLYFGTAGNHLYYAHVNRSIKQIAAWEEQSNYMIDWYGKAGGTSIASAIGFCLAMAAAEVIIILVVFAVLF